MRASFACLAFAPIMLVLVAKADPPGMAPAPPAEREAAGWAEWEAQARMTQGDYDGAVQAQQQAERDQRNAVRQQESAKPSR